MKVFIDGIPLAYPNETLLEPRFTMRRKNDEGEFAVSFTGELSFTGTDYDYIYNKLVIVPGAINNSVVLKFIDDCCDNKEYVFLIKPESLKWCQGSCEITATAVEYTPESIAYACMESTLVWDNWNGFSTQSHPKVKYCLEFRPSLLQDAILIIGLFTVIGATALFFTLATILLPLIGTINLVITFINGIISATGGTEIDTITVAGFDDPIDILNWFIDVFQDTNGQLIAGCGYEHPSPLVRTYVDNVCGKCGLAFSSSILYEPDASKPNHDYWNLVYFSAPVKTGRIDNPFFDTPIVPYIDDNKPLLTGKGFFDEIKQPFNALWDINGSVLRLERRDFFEVQLPFFDVTTYDKEKVISECFEWGKKRRPALGDFQYQRDAIDYVGSEATGRWSDIVEWNSPVNPIQKGIETHLFPYSAGRFRNDGIERDVLSDYEWMPQNIGSTIANNDKAMIMNSGTSFIPKLLIWDGYDIGNATIKRYGSIGGVGVDEAVNYPMWVDANYAGNLYDRFWFINNPRMTSFSGFDFEIKVIWDCNLLNSININGTIMTSKGLSKTLEVIDLDFSTSTLTFKGTV